MVDYKNIKQKLKKAVNSTFLAIIDYFNNIFNITNRGIDKFRIKVMKFLKYENYENEYGFEDLMPKINIENSDEYCKSLDWALKNDKIKNIALTGIYGAGKSSILQTYADLHKEYKYLNISLASFKVQEDNDNELLEKGILKQMFYKVKYKKIPYSRFKKIKTMRIIPILLKLCVLTAIVNVWGILFYPNLLNEIQGRIQIISDLFKISGQTVITILGVMGILTLFIVACFVRYCNSNLKIKKVKIKDGEAEIGEESEKSIFNRYIDELVYFFEATKYDIVIFEDLDRFNNIEVFSNLRDLNILLNNSEQINRRIVFIYAIKDEMFSNNDKESKNYKKDDNVSNKNRTKFFDFIIPVIPIANSANSCDILINKLKEFKQWEGLNEEFISDITFLINDMRILKNIYNEFVIYKNNLEKSSTDEMTNKLDIVKLLAIIVYKNMYPSDFDKLQIDEGMVYEVFNNTKHELIKERIEEINNKYIELEEDIKIAERECLDNIKELRTVCLMPLINESKSNSIRIGQYNVVKFLELEDNDEIFKTFLNENSNNYYVSDGYNGSWSRINDIKIIDDKKEEYKKREKILKLKEENITVNVIEYLKNELYNLLKEKEVVNSLPLKEIIKNNNYKSILNENIKNEKLLLFLIRNGHINEDYSQYISYFYEGTLTREDNNFLYAIKYQESLDYNYKLNKIDMVIKKISKHEFRDKYVLNYMLLDFIIKNKNEKENYKLYYEFIIEQLSNETNSSFEFIKKYIDRGDNFKEFIKDICNKWNGFWQWIQVKSNMSEEIKKLYLKYIVEYSDIEDIKKMNKDLSLKNYISKIKDFLYVFNDKEYIEKIKEVIAILNVEFEELVLIDNDKEYSEKILEFIYEENLYKINKEMILFMLEKYCTNINVSIGYTSILESNCTKLVEYINSNIDKYVNVLIHFSDNIIEDGENIEILLNNGNLDDILKELVIEKLEFIIKDLSKVNSRFWNIIIQYNKCSVNWRNVINYYISIGDLDNILINYLMIPRICNELSKTNIRGLLNDFEEKIIKDISIKIIKCEKLDNESFKKLIKSLPYTYETLNVKGLSLERVKGIIEHNLLSLTQENIENLKENFPKDYLHISLIEKDIDKYLASKEDFSIDTESLNSLLNSKKINDEHKEKILEDLDLKLISNNDNLIKTITKIIMQYNKPHKSLIKKLTDILIEYKLENKLDTETLRYVSKHGIDTNNMIRILTSQIKYLNEKELFNNLVLIGEPYNKITEYNKRPNIFYTPVNEAFIKEMDKKKRISSFKIEADKIKVVNLQKKFKE